MNLLLLPLTCLLSVAQAEPVADLTMASDPDLPVTTRMEAFERLVRTGTTDIGLVASTCKDDTADSRKRWVSCRVLGEVGGDRSRTVLVEMLGNQEPAIRAVSAQALGDLGDKGVTDQLLVLLDEPAVMVRAAAAESLGKLADPKAVEPLAKELFASRSYYRGSSLWVRRHYVQALGNIGHRTAIPALLKSLDDADPQVAGAAVQAFEGVAGFSYAEGRSEIEQRGAWRRWAQSQL